MRVPLCLFAALFLALPAERKQGNPLDHLPPNFEVLTHFGERADISPDNLRVAFMAKSFGDAMVIDLSTRDIRCLTCNVPAAAFLPAPATMNFGFSARSADRGPLSLVKK